MAPFRQSIKHLAEKLQSCEEWIEMVRDLSEPIHYKVPSLHLSSRWAEKGDLFRINALQGFVDEPDHMEWALKKGDRCLLLEESDGLAAFSWVTFRDYGLALWYTLRLPPEGVYLVYIFVHPRIQKQGIGTYLLGLLMESLKDLGYRSLISGMYSTWEGSIRLHTGMGFRIHRRLSQCRLLDIFPTPPRVRSPYGQEESPKA